ncbi:MFS transporter, PAT family, beta-lactamase induction signal transducer AmpG [Duganella sp. CF458]|uniref:MFS transporter n=1 Tax=Duganella sp. CF458 TaxID=1884368 RepID=UPI0008E5EEBD|nr:MFS transporter [Duganella sp. CF458]SFG72785.1 MFS transporter, PAT family, beta-lactamase induction signal transducer AmpG [Duganella sp. CF458]
MDAARHNPLKWIPTLYLAQGLPYFAIALVFGQMMKSMNMSNAEISHWLAFLGGAWIFKPLWSPFLELASSKKLVVVSLQLFGGVCLGLVALALQFPFWLSASVAVLFLASIASATHDISCDGLYIASLSKKGQAQYAGWTGTFFNAGRLLAQGGLLTLAGYLEKSYGVTSAWTVIFGIIGLTMCALGSYNFWALPLSPNPRMSEHNAAAVARTLGEVIIDYFRKPGIWISILFIILFRAGEAQVATIGPLFLREARAAGGLGLDTAQVGMVYGTGGTIAFIIGSIAGGYFTSWLSLRRAILFLILAVNLPNLVFYYLSHALPTDLTVIGVALSLEMFGYGFGFVGLILYMMQVVAPGKYTTAHYAFSTGVMQLGFVFFRGISGDIQSALGYKNFFLWVLVAAIPVTILSQFIPMESREQGSGEAVPEAA